MGLSILSDSTGQVSGEGLCAAVRQGLERGTVTVLVPRSRMALEVRRALADRGIGLGVEVLTLGAWAEGLWRRNGDGRRPATSSEVRACAWAAVRSHGCSLSKTPGTVRLVAALAQQPLTAHDGRGLTAQEQEAVDAALRVQRALRERGLIARGELWQAVETFLGDGAPVVATGFARLDGAEADLFAAAARGELVWVAAAFPGPAGDAARSAAQVVAERTRGAGLEVREASVPGTKAARAPQLETLLASVFTDAAPVETDGEVMLLEAEGPEAEAELVSAALSQAADEGAERIALVTRDPERAWRELSPKLSSRGIAVRASWSAAAGSLRQVRLYLAFARQVSGLMHATPAWDRLDRVRTQEFSADGEGAFADDDASALEERAFEAVSLSVGAERDWWPPRAVVDYLVAGPLGVSKERAFALDAEWRGNRTLAPQEVRAELFDLAGDAGPFRRCLEAIGQGDFGRGAEALLPLAAEKRDREAHSALLAVAEAAQEMGQLLDVAALEPEQQLDLLEQVLDARPVGRSMERGRFEEELRCTVELLSPSDAACLRQGSQDVLVMAGQTATQAPVEGLRAKEGALGRILETLGLGSCVPPEETARAEGWAAWAATASRLVVERRLHDESAAPTQLSPMASELLTSVDAGVFRQGLGEEHFARNLSAKGETPEASSLEAVEEAGTIAAGNALLMVAREDLELGLGFAAGEAALGAGDLPVVSATAVERYLECPRRWFFEKALRSQELDAGVTPLAKGNLAHRALEVAHREAANRGDPSLVEQLVGPAFDRLVLDGLSGVGVGADMAPHSLADEGQLREQRRSLEAVAAFERERFRGFRPTLFEEAFGTREHPAVYGGAHVVGFIDRVDVDDEGRALIVDYKNKQSEATFREYAGPARETPLEQWAPRHVQALMYAQVLRRLHPELCPVGAVYLMTGSHRGLWGLTEPSVADAVYGSSLTEARRPALTTENLGGVGFDEVLDRTEEVVANAVRAMLAGDVRPRPCDSRLCESCPVVGCKGRR